MKYSKWQQKYIDLMAGKPQKYIDLMAGKPHNCAVEIIGELERAIEAKDEMFVAYCIELYSNKGKLKEKTHNALKRWQEFNKEET